MPVSKPAAVWDIAVGAERTSAAWDPPDGDVRAVFVCAHGAGGQMNDRSVLAVTKALRGRGIGTVRFNFLYRARGSGRPDPMPRLIECFDAVVSRVRDELNPAVLLLGGRSMGGRAASMYVAQGAPCEGLLLLAYPLHPPGQPAKLRVEHLPSIRVPVLCVNGTRDPFSERPLMDGTVATLGENWRLLWLEGADHSFHVLKSSGRNDAAVLDEVAGAVDNWVAAVAPRV
jgi:uncharacterized protein